MLHLASCKSLKQSLKQKHGTSSPVINCNQLSSSIVQQEAPNQNLKTKNKFFQPEDIQLKLHATRTA